MASNISYKYIIITINSYSARISKFSICTSTIIKTINTTSKSCNNTTRGNFSYFIVMTISYKDISITINGYSFRIEKFSICTSAIIKTGTTTSNSCNNTTRGNFSYFIVRSINYKDISITINGYSFWMVKLSICTSAIIRTRTTTSNSTYLTWII